MNNIIIHKGSANARLKEDKEWKLNSESISRFYEVLQEDYPACIEIISEIAREMGEHSLQFRAINHGRQLFDDIPEKDQWIKHQIEFEQELIKEFEANQ